MGESGKVKHHVHAWTIDQYSKSRVHKNRGLPLDFLCALE